MDVSLFNKYDSIKRKNRTPSYKALLSIQLSSNFAAKDPSQSAIVTSTKKKNSVAMDPTTFDGEDELKKKQKQSVPRSMNNNSSFVALVSDKMDVYSKAEHQLNEEQAVDEEIQSTKHDSSFLSECSESVMSFDGFPEEDESSSTSNQHLNVLSNLNSSRSSKKKSSSMSNSDNESAYGTSKTTGSCSRSKSVKCGAVTGRPSLTSTPSKYEEPNALVDLPSPLVQLPAKVKSSSPFEIPLLNTEKSLDLPLEDKHVKEVASAVPKILKKRPSNSVQAKEMHLNLQNALSDALSFFEETMSHDCEAKENKPIILDKQLSPSTEIKTAKKDKETISNLNIKTNEVIEKDHKKCASVPDAHTNTPPVLGPPSSLQDALSDAVDFFKATSFDTENVYAEISIGKIQASRNEDFQPSLTPEVERKVNIGENVSKTSCYKDSTVCKINGTRTSPEPEIEDTDDSVDEAMFAAAKAALIGSESTCSVLGYGKKSVSQDSALHLAMSDVITHWLTTGQANYEHPQDEDEQMGMVKNSPGELSDVESNEDLSMEENASKHQRELMSKDFNDSNCYDISPISLDGLEHILEHGSDKPAADSIRSVNNFILQSSHSMKGEDMCLPNGPWNDELVAHNRTKLPPEEDILGAELHNSPAEVYNCCLKLSMDPTVPLPKGALSSLFKKAFSQSPLSRESSCFSTCYQRYTALISRAEEHEKKRLQEMSLIADTKDTEGMPSNTGLQKRKYTKRKHLDTPQEQQQQHDFHVAAKKHQPLPKVSRRPVFLENMKESRTDKQSGSHHDKKSTMSNKKVKRGKKRRKYRKSPIVSAETELKRANLRLRLHVPLENYGCLSDYFVMNAETLEMPYLSGWRREVVYRLTGVLLCDVYYYSPSGEKFRSSAGVTQYLLSEDSQQHLKERHFDFGRRQHNLGAPYEFIRPAAMTRGRKAKHATARQLRKKWHSRPLNLVSDYDFLGFMEDNSSPDFEGFTADDRAHKRQKLSKELSHSSNDQNSIDDGDSFDDNYAICSDDGDSSSIEDGDEDDIDDEGSNFDDENDEMKIDRASLSYDSHEKHESPVQLKRGEDKKKCKKSLCGSDKKSDDSEKLHVNVSSKPSSGRGLFEDSIVDELHMELYAADVDMKDDSTASDGEEVGTESQESDAVTEEVSANFREDRMKDESNCSDEEKGENDETTREVGRYIDDDRMKDDSMTSDEEGIGNISPTAKIVAEKSVDRRNDDRLRCDESLERIAAKSSPNKPVLNLDVSKRKSVETSQHRDEDLCEFADENPQHRNDENESYDEEREYSSVESMDDSNLFLSGEDESLELVETAVVCSGGSSAPRSGAQKATCASNEVVTSRRGVANSSGSPFFEVPATSSPKEGAVGKFIPPPKSSLSPNKTSDELLKSSSSEFLSLSYSNSSAKSPERQSTSMKGDSASHASFPRKVYYEDRVQTSKEHDSRQQGAGNPKKLKLDFDLDKNFTPTNDHRESSAPEHVDRSTGSLQTCSQSACGDSVSDESFLPHSKPASGLRGKKSASVAGETVRPKKVPECDASVASNGKPLMVLPSPVTTTEKCRDSVVGGEKDSTSEQKSASEVGASKLTAGNLAGTQNTAASVACSSAPGGQKSTSGSQMSALVPQISAPESQKSVSGHQIPPSGSQMAASGPQKSAPRPDISAPGSQIFSFEQHKSTPGRQKSTSGPQISASGPQISAYGPQVSTSGKQISTSGPQISTSAARILGRNAVVAKGSGIITFKRNLLFPAINSNKSQTDKDMVLKNTESKNYELASANASKKIITFKISDLIDTPKTT